MKNITLLMLILINISCNSQKETNFYKGKTDLEEKEIHGKVKSVSYFYSENGGGRQKSSKQIFNKEGNITKKYRHYTDGSPDITTYHYDKNGNNSKIQEPRRYAILKIEGNKKTTKEYEKNSDLILTEVEIRDENRNKLESTIIFEINDGLMNSKRVYNYDENNNEISQKVYGGKELTYETTYTSSYNEFNKIILIKIFSLALQEREKLTGYHKYFYDENQNLIKIEYVEIPSEQEEKRGEDIYIYNADNQMIEYQKNRTSDLEPNQKTTYQYLGDNLTIQKLFNEDGKLLETEQFEYDEHNNQISRKLTIEKGIEFLTRDVIEKSIEIFTTEYEYY